MSLTTKCLKLVVLVGVLVLVVQYLQYWLANKRYVFSKEEVAKLAKQYAGKLQSLITVQQIKCCIF